MVAAWAALVLYVMYWSPCARVRTFRWNLPPCTSNEEMSLIGRFWAAELSSSCHTLLRWVLPVKPDALWPSPQKGQKRKMPGVCDARARA